MKKEGKATYARGAAKKTLTEAFMASVRAVAQARTKGKANEFTLSTVSPVRLVIAYSGGRDSAALLTIAAASLKQTRQSEISSITAVYINHGLSENADEWGKLCAEQCKKLAIPFEEVCVFVSRASRQGLEAAAREARYRALYKKAVELKADAVMTAHHLDDQLETFLISWMRGSGLEGLSSLPPMRDLAFGKGVPVMLARPFLQIEREAINAYVKSQHLSFVEDESNTDTRYLRNLIRNKVFPVLAEAREGWKEAADRSIQNISAASDILKDLALEDTRLCLNASDNSLSIKALRNLTKERQALVVRTWLKHNKIRYPSKAKLTETLRQIFESDTDTKLAIRFEGKELRRWGMKLILTDVVGKRPIAALDQDFVWKGEASVSFPAWGGSLCFIPCQEGEEGFDVDALKAGSLHLRARRGGEKLKLYALRPSRNLKHLYQAAKIPPFERVKLPLLWLNDTLIFAAGLGSDIRHFAETDLVHNRVRLVWVPHKNLLD